MPTLTPKAISAIIQAEVCIDDEVLDTLFDIEAINRAHGIEAGSGPHIYYIELIDGKLTKSEVSRCFNTLSGELSYWERFKHTIANIWNRKQL